MSRPIVGERRRQHDAITQGAFKKGLSFILALPFASVSIRTRAPGKRFVGDVAARPNSSQKDAVPIDQSPSTRFQNATMSSRNSVASPPRLPSLAPFLPYPAFSE